MQKTRGLSNEGKNSSELGSRNVGETPRNTASDITGNSRKDTQISAEQVRSGDRAVVSGDSNGNTGRNTADTNVPKGLAPEQLKLDFNASSPEDTALAVAKGEMKLASLEDADTVIKRIIADSPEISGRTFKDVAQDADSYFNRALKDNPQKAAAYFEAKNPDEADQIVREQLAAVEYAAMLRDIEQKASPREKLRIYSAVCSINKYIDHAGSRIAAALNYQKVVNKAQDVFGVQGLSYLALQGINSIADVLNRMSLNFTRNMPLQDFKAEFYNLLKENPAYTDILADKKLMHKLDDVLKETFRGWKAGKNTDPSQVLVETILQDQAEELSFYAKLCDNTGSWIKTIVNSVGGVGGYIANNVLTFGSLCKGVTTAVIQNGLFPSYKILGGLMPWNDGEITREGIDELTCTLVNIGEAARLAKQAWINGEGILVTPRELLNGVWENSLSKWGSIKENGLGITLKNLYTIIPRSLVCTDEFFSQLMYRNIKRAEALRAARKSVLSFRTFYI